MQMFQFTSISMLWVLGVSLMGGLHVQFTITNSFLLCFFYFSLLSSRSPSFYLCFTHLLSISRAICSSFPYISPFHACFLSFHLFAVVLCHFRSDIYYLLAAKLKYTQPHSCTMYMALAVISISSGQLLVWNIKAKQIFQRTTKKKRSA